MLSIAKKYLKKKIWGKLKNDKFEEKVSKGVRKLHLKVVTFPVRKQIRLPEEKEGFVCTAPP